MSSTIGSRMNIAAMLGAFGVSMPSLPKYVKPVYGRMVHSGSTFSAGRNAEKRKAREHQAIARRRAVTEYRLGYRKFPPAKTNIALMVKMLSNRRLRQRGVAAT